MGEIVNKARLAKILGKTEATLTTWQKEGMPIKETGGKKGKANNYDTAEVIGWMLLRSNSTAQAIEKAKLRLVTAQAELEELKVQEKKEELIPLEKMQYILTTMLGKARAKILALPSRLAPQIANQKEPKRVEKILQGACHEVLNELAYDDLEPDTAPKSSSSKGAKNTRATAAS